MSETHRSQDAAIKLMLPKKSSGIVSIRKALSKAQKADKRTSLAADSLQEGQEAGKAEAASPILSQCADPAVMTAPVTAPGSGKKKSGTHTAHRGKRLLENISKYLLEFSTAAVCTAKYFVTEHGLHFCLEASAGVMVLAVDLVALASQIHRMTRVKETCKQTTEQMKTFMEDISTLSPAEKELFSDSTIKNILELLEKQIAAEEEACFREKAKTGYQAVRVIGSTLIALSLACPALLAAGSSLIVLSLIVQHLDAKCDYRLSHWFTDKYNDIKKLPGFFQEKKDDFLAQIEKAELSGTSQTGPGQAGMAA